MNLLDDRLGYATHFDQGWPLSLLPIIAQSGAGWIRDDLSWSAWEYKQGLYAVPPSKQTWIDAANAAGLKICLCLNYPPTFYTDLYDPTAAANFCAWFAVQQYPKLGAIEVINEPNNVYCSVEGIAWQAKLADLTSAIHTAVKAVSPGTQVIGLGAQGSQIFYMLAYGVQADGIVAHPYSDGDIAERVYEPPYTSYDLWVPALKSKTTLPPWETEWGFKSGTYGEYYQAVNLCRRLLQSLGLGVAHTFIYDFMDSSGEVFGVLTGNITPKQAYLAVQRTIAALAGLVASGELVWVGSINPAFKTSSIRAYAFQGPTKTVVAAWIGDGMPDCWVAPVTVTLTLKVAHPHTHSTVIDPVLGTAAGVTASGYHNTQTGSVYTITLPVTTRPVLVAIE